MLHMFLHYTIICYVICVDQIYSQSVDWQSFIRISGSGMQFAPIDEQALLLAQITTNSLQLCTRECHLNSSCRTFDYDTQSLRCRLFEGDIGSAGSIISSNSSFSTVGLIELVPYLFSGKGQPCTLCTDNRYLACVNGTCECPRNTYFDGSVCRSSQFKLGAPCEDSSWCRDDLNFTCLPRKQCGPLWLQNGTTIAGTGTAGSSLASLNQPWGISVASDGAIFVGDEHNDRVIRFREDSLNGIVVAGMGGSGTNPNQLRAPTSVVVDTSFNIYVTDMNNHRIMLWPNSSLSGIRVAGTGVGGSTPSTFGNSYGLAIDSLGNIYVSDSSNARIMKWTPNATNGTIVAGTGIQGIGSDQLNQAQNLFLDESHSYLYIADQSNHRIVRYTLGSLTGTVVAGGNGAGPRNDQFYKPSGICLSKKTGALYVSEYGQHRVQRWGPGATSGVTIVGTVGVSGSSSSLFNQPAGVALSTDEDFLYVVDRSNHRIQRFQLI